MPRKIVPKTRGVYEHPKSSGIWWIHYYDADGQRHREKVGRRGDAVDLYKQRKTEARAGKKLPRNLQRGGVTFQQLADDILIYSANHHEDTRNVKSRLKLICADFGNREAAAIKQAEIDSWIASHTKTAGTFNRYRALFSLVYREALRNDKVASNPARLVRQKNEGSGRIRYLLDNEEQALKQTVVTLFPEHLPELVIAIGAGIRKSEQYTLDWTQIDFNRRVVKLNKTKNHLARDVPMNSDVLSAFKTLRGNIKKPAGRVFPISDPKGWFKSALRQSGVKDFRWHDCRHTFCSRLAMAGVPLKTIQVLAGHKTISITARYAHLAPNTLRKAVELISQVRVKSPVRTATGTAINKKWGNRKEAKKSQDMATT